MSRVGKKIISIPEKVEMKISGNKAIVSGPRGVLEEILPGEISVKVEGNVISVSASDSSRRTKALWGLIRSDISNMIEGVTTGFRKELELSGIGLKVKKDGKDLILSLGFSHPVRFVGEPGIEFDVKDDIKLSVIGNDLRQVGSVSALIRSLKEPEPYKGKGIKYLNEVIRRKAGKVGKVGAAVGGK